MKLYIFFSFKVFFTVILTGPILLGVMMMIIDPLLYSTKDIFAGFIYELVFGVGLLIPSWLIMAMVIKVFFKGKSEFYIKVWLTSISWLFILLPLAILNWHALVRSNYWPSNLPAFSSYTVTLVACIWCFNLKKQIHANLT